MNDVLADAKQLLSNWKCGGQRRKRTWDERQNTLSESWEEVRNGLMEVLLQTKFAVGSSEDFLCESCSDARAVIRCEDCNVNRYVCGSCDVDIHKCQPFHDRVAILNGFHEPIPSTVSINSKEEWSTSTVGKYITT
jgi:hypothetical protein